MNDALPPLPDLMRLARDTVSDPRGGAATVLSFGLSRGTLWHLFALVAVFALMLGDLTTLLLPVPDPELQPQVSSLVLGLVQIALFYLMVAALYYVGRAFGGTGDFDGALTLVIWLQFILLFAQIAQLVAFLILPPLATLIFLAALALFFWLLVNFAAELHGFTSHGKVFLVVLGTMFAAGFVLFRLAALFGLGGPLTGVAP